MKDHARAILGLQGKDGQIANAKSLVFKAAKDFVGKHQLSRWNQALHAAFAYSFIMNDWANLNTVERRVFLHEIGNASAFRQDLESQGVLPKATSLASILPDEE